MNLHRWCACIALTLAAVPAFAASLDEDEARMAALIRAEQAAAARAAAAPVLAAAIAPPSSPNDDWLAAPRTPATLAFDELASHVGERLTVVTRGEHVHRGTLSAATARALTLVVRQRGGKASYTLHRDQVVRIEPH